MHSWGSCKIIGNIKRAGITYSDQTRINPAGAGPPRHPPAAGGHKVAPLYFYDDIVATRRDREAKLCTHLPEYLAELVFKFGVDPI